MSIVQCECFVWFVLVSKWEVCIICSTKGNVLEIWKCEAGVLLLAQPTTLNGGKCE